MTEDEKAKVKAYVEAVASVAMPDPDKSPHLAELVEKFQRHRCRKACSTSRKVKSTNADGQAVYRWKYVSCRYGFPKEPSNQFELKPPSSTIKSMLKTACTHEMYQLPRRPEEININAYHPLILYLLQANMDIKVVKDEHGKLIFYVTKYVTKDEKDPKGKEVYEAVSKVNPHASLHSRAISTAITLLKNVEMGQEAVADYLHGVPLLELSDKVTFLNVQPKSKRKQLLKGSLEKLQEMDNPEETNAAFPGFWGNYPKRSEELEHVCAFDLERLYDRITDKEYNKRMAKEDDRRKQALREDKPEPVGQTYYRCQMDVPADEIFHHYKRATPKVNYDFVVFIIADNYAAIIKGCPHTPLQPGY